MLSVKSSIFTAVVREKLTKKETLKQTAISTLQLEKKNKNLDIKARVYLECLRRTMEGITVDKKSDRIVFRAEHGSLTL